MNVKKLSFFFLVLVLLLSLIGCSAGSESVKGNDNSQVSAEAPSLESTASQLPENRKLIQTVRMNVEVYELNSALSEIEARMAEQGGYLESSNIYHGSAHSGKRYRTASLTIRIPAHQLSAFLTELSAVSNVVSSNKTVEDVTLSYVATESRLKALQTEETRLLELLAQAETMDDLLTIESRLTDVRTELEKVASTLKVYDNQVDYATVHLEIGEVQEYTVTEEPKSVWERIGTGFVNSLNGLWNFIVELFVWFIIALPYLLPITGIVVLIIHFKKRADKKRRTPPPVDKNEK